MTGELPNAVQMHPMSVLRTYRGLSQGCVHERKRGGKKDKKGRDVQSAPALDGGLLHARRRARGDAVGPELRGRAVVVREGEDERERGGDERELRRRVHSRGDSRNGMDGRGSS